MPEAAVDEYRHFLSDKADIGPDYLRAALRENHPVSPVKRHRDCHPSFVRRGAFWKPDLEMQPVTAMAGVPEGFAEEHFGL